MAERPARRRKSSKSVEQLKAEISARDEAKANRAAERKPSGAAAEAQEAARKRRNAEKYEQEKSARAKKGSSGYGYSRHLMGGSSRSSSFNPRSVREEVLVNYLLDEGFASDEKSAQAIMGAMSEDWRESIIEATAMAKRGYDEAPIRQKIAASTGGGKAADKAKALADRSTYGDEKTAKARRRLARSQMADFRKTTSSNPGLHGYAHKSDDPAVKAKQAARGAQRGALTPKEKKQLGR